MAEACEPVSRIGRTLLSVMKQVRNNSACWVFVCFCVAGVWWCWNQTHSRMLAIPESYYRHSRRLIISCHHDALTACPVATMSFPSSYMIQSNLKSRVQRYALCRVFSLSFMIKKRHCFFGWLLQDIRKIMTSVNVFLGLLPFGWVTIPTNLSYVQNFFSPSSTPSCFFSPLLCAGVCLANQHAPATCKHSCKFYVIAIRRYTSVHADTSNASHHGFADTYDVACFVLVHAISLMVWCPHFRFAVYAVRTCTQVFWCMRRSWALMKTCWMIFSWSSAIQHGECLLTVLLFYTCDDSLHTQHIPTVQNW